MAKITKINHIAILVSDLESPLNFWRDALGLELTQVEEILTTHRDELVLLADTLVERETLDDDEIRILLGFPERAGKTTSAVPEEGK